MPRQPACKIITILLLIGLPIIMIYGLIYERMWLRKQSSQPTKNRQSSLFLKRGIYK